jgi:CubicO group peptidase (beta-lactamase class C family)
MNKLAFLTITALLLTPQPAVCAEAVQKPTGKPNVVYLLADDLGWGDISTHGGTIATPNIDRLFKQGVELRNFMGWCVCSPTRAMLLTGRHPFRVGTGPEVGGELAKEETTIAEGFKAHGYRTVENNDEIARIAYCMLRGGRWGKTQVIPPWYVEQTAAPTHNVTTPELRWKLNPAVFSHGWELPARHYPGSGKHIAGIPADARYKPGSGGQLIAFVPSLDLVIARQTGESGDWDYEEFLRRACEAVLAAPLNNSTSRETPVEGGPTHPPGK